MQDIQSRNRENKAINLILEFSVGKVNKVIDDMVSYRAIWDMASTKPFAD